MEQRCNDIIKANRGYVLVLDDRDIKAMLHNSRIYRTLGDAPGDAPARLLRRFSLPATISMIESKVHIDLIPALWCPKYWLLKLIA
jgi:hypothetical protein